MTSVRNAAVVVHSRAEARQIVATAEAPALHVGATLKRGCDLAGYVPILHAPEANGLLWNGFRARHFVRSSDLTIVCQGVGMIAAGAGCLMTKKPPLVVHTWKMPGTGSRRAGARAMDLLMERLIHRSCLTIVVCESHVQTMRERFPLSRCVLIPVAADTSWFSPGVAETDILDRLGVRKDEFVLCGGDIDRDEVAVIRAAKATGMKLVRVTRDDRTADNAKRAAKEMSAEISVVVRVPWSELRDLYRSAFAVIVAPRESYHPAGLTSVSEAMACGAAVIFPENGTERGYIDTGTNGVIVRDLSEESLSHALRLLGDFNFRQNIRHNARRVCEERLNLDFAAAMLAKELAVVCNE